MSIYTEKKNVISNTDTISVIVPVYNAEKYISKCIKSIISQTYKDFELIIINDGSVDHTLEVCMRYAKEDIRIKVINQHNSGVSKARNKGMLEASGSYIMFVDADDWLDSDYLSIMKNAIGDYDIAISSFTDEYEEGSVKRKFHKVLNHSFECVDEVLSSFAEDCLTKKMYTYVVWGKLYRKDCINDILFPNQAYSEDTMFIRAAVLKAKSIRFVDDEGYHYYINSNSVTSDSSRVTEVLYGSLNLWKNFYDLYNKVMTDEQKKKTAIILYNQFRWYLRSAIKTGKCITYETIKSSEETYANLVSYYRFSDILVLKGYLFLLKLRIVIGKF